MQLRSRCSRPPNLPAASGETPAVADRSHREGIWKHWGRQNTPPRFSAQNRSGSELSEIAIRGRSRQKSGAFRAQSKPDLVMAPGTRPAAVRP